MKKIPFIICIIILFFSCKPRNKKQIQQPELPKNTSILTFTPKILVKQLPDKLRENSGLIYYNNLFWTFNDSGGSNKIFAVNKRGEIEDEFEIEDAKNVDWEDIAQDSTHIYIGDFGNNNGVRKNLKIYKIDKRELNNSKKNKIKKTEIDFKYANQAKFEYTSLSTKFDCEALVEFNDHLYVFTKDWSNRTTTVYKVPAFQGNYTVTPIKTFEANGLITGADVSPDKKKIVLIGYKNYNPFGWLFTNFDADNFFEGEKTYLQLKGIFDAQTEGVCFMENSTIAISCEQTGAFNQQIFTVDLNKPE